MGILLLKRDGLLVNDMTGILVNLKIIKGLNVEDMIKVEKKIKTNYGKECLEIINNVYD